MKGDLAQLALEVAIAAEACNDNHALSTLFATAFGQLGAEVHLIVTARAESLGPELRIGFGRTSSAWEARYRSAGHARRDPLVRHLLGSPDLLAWSDLNTPDTPLSQSEEAVIQDIQTFGFSEAIIAPQHQPGGAAAAVLLMGRAMDARDRRWRQAARTLSDAYFRNARRLNLNDQGCDCSLPNLSPREIEVLYRVKTGQSDKAAAQAMSLSHHTVTGYLRSAQRKLGAHGRVSAAHSASDLGLLPNYLP